MPTLSSPCSSPSSSSSSIFYLMPEIESRTSCLSAKHSATEAHFQPLVSRTMKKCQIYSVVSVAEWIAVTLG